MNIMSLILITALGAFCSMSLPFLLKYIGIPVKTEPIRKVQGFTELL